MLVDLFVIKLSTTSPTTACLPLHIPMLLFANDTHTPWGETAMCHSTETILVTVAPCRAHPELCSWLEGAMLPVYLRAQAISECRGG
eukprot:6333918-Amphidinium_carterae.1